LSLAAYQTALGRLVTDRGFRARIRGGGEAALAGDLTDREQRRLSRLAGDHGVEVTATLVASFRLGKLLSLLPLTRTLLGPARFAGEAQRFWDAHPPVSFYLPDEALAFCEHLRRRARAIRLPRHLDQVLAYERAMIELNRVRPDGRRPGAQRIRFRHDPARLLTALAAGRRPSRVPLRPCSFIGTVTRSQGVEWRVAAEVPRRRR